MHLTEQEKALAQTHTFVSQTYIDFQSFFHSFVQPRLNPTHNLTETHSALTLKFSVRESEDRPKCPRFKEMRSLRWIKTYSGPHNAAFLQKQAPTNLIGDLSQGFSVIFTRRETFLPRLRPQCRHKFFRRLVAFYTASLKGQLTYPFGD